MSRALRAQRRDVIAAKHLFCNGSPDFDELPFPPPRKTMVTLQEIQSSSNLAAAGYSPVDRIFAVRFKNGRVYHYRDVSPETFAAYEKAESKGSYFARQIKPHHDHEVVSEAADATPATAAA